REVDVWRRLKHKNILSFIGVCEDLAPSPVLISPFYKFGDVGNYLSKHPGANKGDLALGVASGLEFLHGNNVVHGDLKQNVLIDKHGIPCICDFGISKIVGNRGFKTSNVGTAPYMAPELFFVVDGPNMGAYASSPSTTTSSDVYSFALLVLEVCASPVLVHLPFDQQPIVTARILADLRPKRADYDERKVPQTTWFVLNRCWSFNPLLRPSVSEVLVNLSSAFAASPLKDLFDLEEEDSIYYIGSCRFDTLEDLQSPAGR
ncbi:kinase-like domain-containing protein, partial [Mycena galopus ATCC 62051]